MFSKTVQNTLEVSASFKDIIKIKSKEELEKATDKDFSEFLNPKK
jgi:hypothetical protein